MIDRYSRPEMTAVWTEERRLECWLAVELALVDALAAAGQVPIEAAAVLRRDARIAPARMREIEREVKHDVIAFVSSVAERLGDEARFLHLGLTSSDVVDTAFAIQLRDAGAVLLESLGGLQRSVRILAEAHRRTPIIGRTHGIHAEPTTFGLKVAGWYAELGRGRRRLKTAVADISHGKLSGAVGTFANNPPTVEAAVMGALGLVPEPIASQVVPRDRHAVFFSTLALLAGTCERIALEIRHLQRTEVGEVAEPFGKGQKGSSAMPHKRNPILTENVCGLARLIRSYAQAALENVALWHERDISHSSVERVIAPDATIALDFMLARLAGVIDGLVVRAEVMRANLDRLGGAVYSEQVLLALVRSGVLRDQAYRMIQRHALAGDRLLERLSGDPEITAVLPEDRLRELFDLEHHLRYTDVLFERAMAEGDGGE